VVIGFAAGRIPTIKANYLLLKNIEVSGMQVSDYRKRTPDLMDRCFADIFAQLASGALKPLPVKTYPIADFAAGLREIRDRTQRGRIVLTQSD
jgi:NADPH2:quinone reductase